MFDVFRSLELYIKVIKVIKSAICWHWYNMRSHTSQIIKDDWDFLYLQSMTYAMTMCCWKLLCFIFSMAVIYMAFTACMRLKLCLGIANPLRNMFILQWNLHEVKSRERISSRHCVSQMTAIWQNHVKQVQANVGVGFFLKSEKI